MSLQRLVVSSTDMLEVCAEAGLVSLMAIVALFQSRTEVLTSRRCPVKLLPLCPRVEGRMGIGLQKGMG